MLSIVLSSILSAGVAGAPQAAVKQRLAPPESAHPDSNQSVAVPASSLRCAGRDGHVRYVIAPDGTATPEPEGDAGKGAGQELLVGGVRRSDGAGASLEVVGRGAASRKVIVLTGGPWATKEVIDPGVEHLRDVQWLANGSLLFQGALDGRLSIFTIDLGQRDSRAVRLSPGDRNCMIPAGSSTGAVAWAAEVRREGKGVWKDIVVREASGDRTLLKEVDASALAFSPDGTKLAVGCIGTLYVLEVATGKELRRWEYSALDQRLYAHHPDQIVWSPDGSMLAFTNRFAGGRLKTGDGPFEPVFGDREVFILKPDGKLVVCTLPEDAGRMLWSQ